MIEGSGSGYLVLMDPEMDPGGPKTYPNGSRSATLLKRILFVKYLFLRARYIFGMIKRLLE
jgi:hypothetical protein